MDQAHTDHRVGLAGACAFATLLAFGCGDAADGTGALLEIYSCANGKFVEGQPRPNDLSGLPYATELVDYDPGEGAGFGQDELPWVALGAPRGGGNNTGSLDVVSLGRRGTIILGFGDRDIVDGPGPDLVVFENAFWANGDRDNAFVELAEVSASLDGETWIAWPCDAQAPGVAWPGCAGWRTVQPFMETDLLPIDPSVSGGDPFDLADIGLTRARYVRVTDLTGQGLSPSVGFDLDAVGIVHCVGPEVPESR